MKNINWINQFIEEQKEQRDTFKVNKKFLKQNNLYIMLEIDNQNIKNIEKDIIALHNNILDVIKILRTQKGRITRQTNEQNTEKKILIWLLMKFTKD